MKRALLCSLFVFFASTVFAQVSATQSPLPAACGPSNMSFWSKAEERSGVPDASPEAGKARIYFFHQIGNTNEHKYSLGMPTFPIALDGKWVGAVHDNSYLFVDVAPGEHHVCVILQKVRKDTPARLELMPIEAEAGKSYYLLTRYFFSGENGLDGFILSVANRDMARYWLDTLPRSNWKTKE